MAGKLDPLNYAFANIDPTRPDLLRGDTRPPRSDPRTPTPVTARATRSPTTRSFGAGDIRRRRRRRAGTSRWPATSTSSRSSRRSTRTSRSCISIGGWTYSKYFSDAAATAASRQKLRQLLHRHVHQGQPAAVDGDRRPRLARPASSTASTSTGSGPARRAATSATTTAPQDKPNFTALLAEFRTQLDAYGATGKQYLLTAFLPADPAKIDAGWDISADGIFSVARTSPPCRATTSTAPAATTRGSRTAPATRPTCTPTPRTRTPRTSASRAPSHVHRRRRSTRGS